MLQKPKQKIQEEVSHQCYVKTANTFERLFPFNYYNYLQHIDTCQKIEKCL